MKIRDIMTKKVISIPAHATLRQAASILAENEISGAPVVSEAGKLLGIVSEKDLFKALYPSHAEFYESPGVWIDLDAIEKKTVEAADKPVLDLMSKTVIT